MKKGIAISLIFIHLLFTVGVKIDMHFCADNLKSISFSKLNVEDTHLCCSHESSTTTHEHTCKKSSCCEDASATLLSLNSFSSEQIKFVSTEITTTAIVLPSLNSEQITSEILEFTPPPILQGRAVYLTTSSFCFYG